MNDNKKIQANINISAEQLEFSVFCIENIAIKLGLTGDKVYELLTKNSTILYEYIIPFYGVLHTQGKEYIVDDIIDTMRKRGIIE